MARRAARAARPNPGQGRHVTPLHLPNQQRHAQTPHHEGLDIDADSTARRRTELGLSPVPFDAHAPRSVTPEQRREQQEAVAKEIDQIAQLFSRGMGEHEIRAVLGLSRKRYEHRVRRMKKAALDAPLVWTKFVSGAQQDMKRLFAIYSRALKETKPRYSTALDAIAKMHDIRCSIIEMGQELGVYDVRPDDFGVGWPELTMALLMGTASRGGGVPLPMGNLHREPPRDLAMLPARDGEDAMDQENADDDFAEDEMPAGAVEVVDAE